MQEQSYHRTDRHRYVVGQSVVPQSLAPARRGHDIDHDRVAGHRNHAEREAVHDAQYGEQRERPRQQIAREDGSEDEKSQQIERLARERIEQIARKRPDRQRRDRIARQHGPRHAAARAELLRQIERQDRHQQVKTEKKQEISGQDIAITRCDQTFFRHSDRNFDKGKDVF